MKTAQIVMLALFVFALAFVLTAPALKAFPFVRNACLALPDLACRKIFDFGPGNTYATEPTPTPTSSPTEREAQYEPNLHTSNSRKFK